MKVMVLKTDTRLGIKSGETYEGCTYQLDPGKIVLSRRIPDGYEPMCLQYKHEVAININGQWCKSVNNQYITMTEKEIEGITEEKV